jgi:hypothetical protein
VLTVRDLTLLTAQSALFAYNSPRSSTQEDWLKTMKILQLNIRIINTSKFLLRDHIKDNNIDVACLTETWQIGNDNSILNLTGLKPEFKNRSSGTKGGGAAILLSPNVKAVRRKDLEVDDLEAVFVEATVNGKATVIGSVYIPPGHAHGDKITILDGILNAIPNSSLLITGDFNARSPSWEPNSINRASTSSESCIGVEGNM